ncbi:AAA family ATPase [Archaeoglobus sp.]
MSIEITIENIGPITKADLDLGQITVIVGENNVGKSFVLKSIYSIFKAFEMERMLLRDEVERALRTCELLLSASLKLLRKSFIETDEEMKEIEELKEKASNLLRDIEFLFEGRYLIFRYK